MQVFLSVGRTTDRQEKLFLEKLEEQLRAKQLDPRTIGRNTFTSGQPLDKVKDVMRGCHGAIAVVFGRTVVSGKEYLPYKDGSTTRQEKSFSDRTHTTPWHHIELAMASILELPILVLVQEGVFEEGLLEDKYGWFVIRGELHPSQLDKLEIQAILTDWIDRVKTPKPTPQIKVDALTIGQLVRDMRPSQMWAIGLALVTLLSGAALVGRSSAKFASTSVGHILLRQTNSLRQVFTQRLRTLTFKAVNTQDGFVMNCDVDYINKTFKCLNQDIPLEAISNEQVLKNELELEGPDTVRSAAQENLPTGHKIASLSVRVIFDQMGNMNEVQSVDGKSFGTDHQPHTIDNGD
jgi:hypothetical protein